MNPDTWRLVYVSRNRIRGEEAALAAEAATILEASRRNNPRVGVTGALMFNRGLFAQVLEGPQAAVEDTFERIQGDDRHGEVALLSFAPCAARAFPHWSMAHVGTQEADAAALDRFAAESGFDIARLDGERLFTLLRERLARDDA
ncbi:BLUF domain-containing protein [Roseococcus sp. DSY-14]|uniref:BLUF domain-containing protein n=1 Tax=Roseococcus sp. DSY-14 TaxID=3369650 RepID=UPI00387AA9F0